MYMYYIWINVQRELNNTKIPLLTNCVLEKLLLLLDANLVHVLPIHLAKSYQPSS
jgi:hypothetical protein